MAQLTQGDGAEQLDLRLTRGFKIGERKRLDLFLEGYNVFNQLPGSQLCPEFVVVPDPHRGP